MPVQSIILRRLLAVSSIGIIGLLALSFAAPGDAKRVLKFAKVKATVSAARAADGTITVKAAFTTSNPRCFSKQVVRRLRDGYFHLVGGALYYNATDGYGGPPNRGWLLPDSRPSRTRWIWKAVWPGDAPVTVENHSDPDLPRNYRSTVGDASGLRLIGNSPNGKIKNRRGGIKFKLTCRGSEVNRFFAF